MAAFSASEPTCSNGVSVQKSATNGDAKSSNATADSPSTGTRLSKEKAAAASTQLSAAFGKITAVLMRAPMYRQMHLSDLEWLVAPAVATRQFLIAELQNKTNGLTVPVSAVLWARVSDDVDQRLTSNAGQAIRLRPEEWKSGSIPWLIAAAGEPRTVTGPDKNRCRKAVWRRWHQSHFKGTRWQACGERPSYGNSRRDTRSHAPELEPTRQAVSCPNLQAR